MFGVTVFFGLLILSFIVAPKKWMHDQVGWGYPDGIAEKDPYGFQDSYKCKFCNDHLAQDSNGDYFHLSNPTPLPMKII